MALNYKTLGALVCSGAALNVAHSTQAQTQLELTAGLGYHQLEIFRKAAPADYDHTATVKFALGAYRAVNQHAWGAVAEHIIPINRSNTIGNGKITGFRPVNYRYYWCDSLAAELFLGAAQYDWIKNAAGYYWGASARYAIGAIATTLEYKAYEGLAHDIGPGGDQIISGHNIGLNISYSLSL